MKTVVPHWDNDARREGRGLTLHGSSPARYERWLRGAAGYARANRFAGEALVFVNAWNEWAEGAYLEPDVHWGHAYLNATRRALLGVNASASNDDECLLLVGHDGHRHGAQMLLLHLARTFRERLGLRVVIALKGDGALRADYVRLGRTVVLGEDGGALERLAREEGVTLAICNTAVTGDLVPALRGIGIPTLSLIHELPRLVEEYGLERHLAAVAREATGVVFASPLVQAGYRRFAGGGRAPEIVRPQGSYTATPRDPDARARVRRELGLASTDRLVVNVGYADLRKGVDRFVQSAERLCAERADVHFLWIGAVSEDLRRWIVDGRAYPERILFPGFTDDVAACYSAADAFYLSSREDPYPTVVLEALHAGLPLVVHAGASGFDALGARFGRVVSDASGGIERALLDVLDGDDEAARRERAAYVESECRLEDYCADLLSLLRGEERILAALRGGRLRRAVRTCRERRDDAHGGGKLTARFVFEPSNAPRDAVFGQAPLARELRGRRKPVSDRPAAASAPLDLPPSPTASRSSSIRRPTISNTSP